MIEFVSILLGLVSGVQPVELSAVGPVATVEIQLDGSFHSVLEGPPWVFDCDFGEELTPHRLVAIARDVKGRELDRAQRLINLDAGSAHAKLSLIPDAQGQPSAARLSWESIGQEVPERIEVTFDGEPLAVENPRAIPLPPYDLSDFHFVTATLHFHNNPPRILQAGFGGELGGEMAAELTAVVVEREKGRLPKAAQMYGWFETAGHGLAVHGVEKGEAELVIVRDPSVQPQLEDLAWYLFNGSHPERRAPEEDGLLLARILNGEIDPSEQRPGTGQRTKHLKDFARLGSQAQIRFLSPTAAPLAGGGVRRDLFLRSPDLPLHEESLGEWAVAHSPQHLPTQLADAVAMAGLLAHSSHRRRAVLLLLGEDEVDTSRHSAASVRRYLEDLGVPLLVARFGDEEPGSPWGAVKGLGTLDKPEAVARKFQRLIGDLGKGLEQQRLIWLIGRYLPQHIELGPTASGVRLAGRPVTR